MAARTTPKNMSISDSDITFEDIVSVLKDMEATEDSPVDVRNVAVELDTTEAVIMVTLQNNDPNEIVVDGDRGSLWLSNPEMSVEQMMNAVAARDIKAKKPGPTIAELTRKSVAVKPTPKVIPKPAKVPVKGREGQNITVPVAEGSKERRELDASKGERVLSEESMREVVESLAKRKETPMSEDIGWSNTEHESKLTPEHDSGQYLAPIETIPTPPEGINWNKWELVYTSPTRSARAFWHAQCLKDLEEWNAGAEARRLAAEAARAEAERLVAEAAKVPEPEPVRLCPITGEPLPF